ncbi:MAG: response regulator transcription factor [Chitinophagaceae bacterium]
MAHNTPVIKVALADDHVLMRNGLTKIINGFPKCKVVAEANNGKELVIVIQQGTIPDVIILDINMPVMDGFKTAEWLFDHFPKIHILMLSMYDSELSMIRLIRSGVKGFLKKDVGPTELESAIDSVMGSGFYYASEASNNLMNVVRQNLIDQHELREIMLSDREIEFLRFCSTELSYKEISHKMSLNPRAIEYFRRELSIKLGVQTRVGLVLVAIRHGLIHL